MCVLVAVYLLGGGFQWSKAERIENWGRRWRESFDSHCYCLMMMQSSAMRHLKQLSGLMDTDWTNHSRHGSERQKTEEEEGQLH